MDKVLEIEPIAYKFHKDMAAGWEQELIDYGMKVHDLPPAEAERMIKLANTVTWEFAAKLDPVNAPRLKDSISKLLK